MTTRSSKYFTKALIIVAFWLLNFKSYSQSKTIYIIPDSVESAIKRQLVKLKIPSEKGLIYFLLTKDKDGIYSLSLFRDTVGNNAFISKIIANGERVLLIDKDKYPLMFDYDFTFGTPKENQVGTIGHREGNVLRSTVLFHGYTIFFNTRGTIIKPSEY